MRKKRGAAYGGEVDREFCRAQARDWGAGRKRGREAHIRPDPSEVQSAARIDATESHWAGPALARHGRAPGRDNKIGQSMCLKSQRLLTKRLDRL